jgi:ABC-type multidrug transport system ATPase subunit
MSQETVISVKELTKRFRSRTAVDALTLDVRKGDIYGFLGPNGAGKSTTMRMMLGLIKPNGGEIRLFGRNVRSERRAALGRVGAIVESPAFHLFLSGRRNLRILAEMSGGASDKRIDEVLEIVKLSDRQHDKVAAYSMGMKQRLGIAQALLPDPELVILDEPTVGLDPQGMKEVRDLIKQLTEKFGITVFLSSHLLAEVQQICNRVGIINLGRLIFEGTVAELLREEENWVSIGVDSPARAAEVLRSIQGVRSADPFEGGVKAAIDGDIVPEMVKSLVENGLRVREVGRVRDNLEDVFLRLTRKTGK